MANLNCCHFIGNLGRDPEVRFTPSGQAVANFSIACTDKYTKDGVAQEKTEWVNIVVWGKTAENCGQYLSKGRPVFIQGRLQTRSYDDKDGNKRYVTEVVADRVQFLSAGRGQQGGGVSADADAGPDPFATTSDSEAPF